MSTLNKYSEYHGIWLVGWEALWDGWFALTKLLEGAKFMQQQMLKM